MIKPQTRGSKKAGAKKAIKTKKVVKIKDGNTGSSSDSTTQREEEQQAVKNIRRQFKRATLKWCPKQESQSSSKETGCDNPDTQDEVLIKL